MIVGNGLLAAAFSDDFTERVDTVIFASGVSNSQECDSAAFIRERVLLEKVLQKERKKVVYFSTCSLYDPELKNSPYVKHKREMEALVRQTSRHTIFRLPQVVGKILNARAESSFFYKYLLAN